MPFSAFGAQTDHFGLVAGDSDLTLKSSKKVPRPKNKAEAKDELGDIVAQTFFGPASPIYDIECTYTLKAGSIDLSTLDLGNLTVGETSPIMLSISVSTSNGGFPEFTCTGVLGHLLTEIAGTDYLWSLPAITVYGRKQAQAMGFTTGANCKLTASTFEAEIELTEATSGLGVPVAHDVSGCTFKGTATFVAVTATPTWTVTLSGATETQVPGIEEPDADYGTATGEYEGFIARDVEA